MSDENTNGEGNPSLEERLQALESSESGGGSGTRRQRPNVSPLVAIGGVAAISLMGGLVYLSMQPEEEERMQTGAPAEFQPEGDGFGTITPTRVPEPEPEPQPAAAPNSELLDRIDRLQAEIENLRDAPAEEQDTSEQDARIDDLLTQVEDLQEANEEAQSEFQRQLQQRDRELRQLQADLDLARLQPNPTPATAPAETGPSEEEQRRLAELERRRQEAREFQAARNESGIIAFGDGESDNGAGDEAEHLLDAGTDFIRNGGATAEVSQAEVIANPSNTVPQGTLIQASLETAVDSSTPGQVRALTSENVYSYDGSRVLIPRGSRLIGRYQSGVEIAQKRITIAWDRIILPTQQTVEISAFGGDELGRSGVGGFVDSRFDERFGSAALISLISAGARYGAGQLESEDAADAADQVGGDLESASNSALDDYLSLGPVIHVDQGETVTVMVDRDLEIF